VISTSQTSQRGPRVLGGVVVVAVLVFSLLLLFVASALATFEQVGTFAGQPGLVLSEFSESFPEEVQLGGVGGMAVNVTGAGGVPAGTIYAATSEMRVVRYNPDGSFSESWNLEEGTRCGPEGEPAHSQCPNRRARLGSRYENGVAVDQSTGDVYVFAISRVPGSVPFHVFNADGSKLIASFGEVAQPNVTTAATPEKVHTGIAEFGIAVNVEGTVYVGDANDNEVSHRVMVFEPEHPGDYEHYVYAGQSHDIGSGTFEQPWPGNPVLDDAGNVYGFTPKAIVEYDPSAPATPVCQFNQPDSGITAMTVDPASGEVLYFDYKSKKLHQLSACNAQGEFVETGTIALSPTRFQISALAFNPSRQFEPSRAPGVLYAGGPEAEAVNEGIESAMGFVFAPPVGLPPSIGVESVSGVTAGSAVLHASINPNSAETKYSFEYVSDADYEANGSAEPFAGAVQVPVGGGSLGGGTVALSASAAVSGLEPGTEYHYRVVADNCTEGQASALCSSVGAGEVFRTYPAEGTGLPDGRVYELVSPIEKNDGEVVPAYPEHGSCGVECKPGARFTLFPMQAAPEGNAVVYEGTPFSIGGGAIRENEYFSKRTSSGWQTTALSPASEAYGSGQGYVGFSTDLSEGLLTQLSSIVPSAPSEYPNVYSQPTGDPGDVSPLVTQAPPNRSPGTRVGGNRFEVGFGGASADMSRIFIAADDALTGETSFAPAAVDGGEGKSDLYELHDGQLALVNVDPGNAVTVPGAQFRSVSKDGSRAFWSSEAGQVYVRIGGQLTRELPDHSGQFLIAGTDGSRVLLSDGHMFGKLQEAVPGEEFDLTAGAGGFQGVVGAGEDLSSVYFVDTAVLAGESTRETSPVLGKDNLYYWHEGTTTFVATLLEGDGGNQVSGVLGDWRTQSGSRTAEASPDGRWVAFVSSAQLTGENNIGLCAKQGEKRVSGTCSEDFLYDSVNDRLICVSCARSDVAPVGSTTLDRGSSRYLTDSGRLFFDTPNALAAGDTNGAVEDVYEYEPEGVGSCGDGTGCVLLISAGTGTGDSNFLMMDEDGKNVFFTTRDRLVPSDKDELVDLYDAREGGGFAEEAGSSTQGCSGETCQSSSPSSGPIEAGPGSLVFSGAGNLLAPAPASGTSAKTKTKTLSRAQRLAKALRACKGKPKKKRVMCERSARKRYATASKAKQKAAGGARKGGKS
jgi:hypothetical protein